jgi:prostaglandin-E synthase 1
MLTSPLSPAFIAYAVTAIVLCLNLMFLWGFSGGARSQSKVAINPEDAALFGAALQETDPPAVARVLRAHANAGATIYPFLLLGLVFVLAGGSALAAEIIFAVFVLARLAHSGFYLAGKQPFRTIAFTISAVALLALIVALIWRLAVAGH